MIKKIFLIFSVLIIILYNVPVMADETTLELEKLESESIILMEQSTGRILYEKNSDQKMYPASTTKIMTALIALEETNLDEVIHIGNEVYTVPLDASKAGHLPDDEITMKNLLTALLLPSGNDSALAISTYIAKQKENNQNLSVDEANNIFSQLMNERAKEIGMANTNFVNPHGYHDENHYTTAYDLALLTKEAMKNANFREIVGMPNYTLDFRGNNTTWKNRNLLIDSGNSEYYKYATGVKTGFTDEAGECLVATATKDGMDLIAVVLNSPTDKRWSEVVTLFEYGFNEYSFHQIIKEGELVNTIAVEKSAPDSPSEVEIVASEGYTKLLSKEEINKIEKTIVNKETIEAPIEKGEVLGTVTFTINGEVITEIPLIANESIDRITFFELIFSVKAIPYWAGGISGLILIIIILISINKRKRRKRRSWTRY